MGKEYDRILRADTANEFLAVIASCGRRFFRHDDAVYAFSVDERARVWFTDSYSKRRIYTHYPHEWRGFTNGGTMRGLVERLRDYIMTGAPQRLNLGPWPKHYCDRDLWGYGDDMQRVRDAAARLGIVPANAQVSGGR
jgi:hypothetical protein